MLLPNTIIGDTDSTVISTFKTLSYSQAWFDIIFVKARTGLEE